jgi:hypothetical protein
LIANCSHIDSTVHPLIQYKNALSETNNEDDSRLILFSNRRLYCNKSFKIFFSTTIPLKSFATNTLCSTTPVNYTPSIENHVDQFQAELFELMFKNEFERKNLLLDKIRECEGKLSEIDNLMKKKWQNNGFQDEAVLLTKIALERKYKIGEILDYCYEYMNYLDELYKIILPLSLKSGLLVMLAQRLNIISKNYEFSSQFFTEIFQSFLTIVKSTEIVILSFYY